MKEDKNTEASRPGCGNPAGPPLVIVTGPTAVGKTDISVQLAKRIGGEIISADSMQVYRYMDIGSAKVTPEEMQGVRHYLVDVLEPSDSFDVVRFQKMAEEAAEEIASHGAVPIVAGGTGFYIQSLLYKIDFEQTEEHPEIRRRYEQIAAEKGAEYLHTLLREADPKAAEAIHPSNVKRTVRALEYHELTGKPISEHNEKERAKTSPWHFVYFVLTRNRRDLYDRINRRVDFMFEQGLLDEVRRLEQMGYRETDVAMQGIGYKELLAYLHGKGTLEEAKEQIKLSSRHYAKRQLTWFRRERDVTWVNLDGKTEDEVLDEMAGRLREAGILRDDADFNEGDERADR
ncbi:MAG: tRNA (adenosine(37)-N6)-dimethylallyltransferase MiaA [Lachnospiraceae bacterium]|jgi:tRNA dimethylallyltransferase